MTDHGIAGKAHDLVYGDRARTYGHPRTDFSIIAKLWTGLLQDKLADGAELDAHRVAVMMTGLKLARLVKSPHHQDSRVDTIGYMLTMERLDEPTDEELAKADAAAADDSDVPRCACLGVCDESCFYRGGGGGGEDIGHGLKCYTFAVGDVFPFSTKKIYAATYPEARQLFNDWAKAEQAKCEVSSQLPYQEFTPGPEEIEVLREATAQFKSDHPELNKWYDEMNGEGNPSDQDVETAKAVLARRQAFHDREAQEIRDNQGF